MTHKIPNMSPKQIRRLMFEKDVSQAEIAREKGCHATAVYKVIQGESVSDDIRRRIAAKVGVDIKRIWPDPYLYFGGPRKPGRPFRNGQKQAV